jgi:hypothetical protein
LSVIQWRSCCCPIPWERNIWQRIFVRVRPWLSGNVSWRYNRKIHNYQNIRWTRLGFCFGVVMELGHIIARYKNMSDIADIYGDRRGVGTCWTFCITRLWSRKRTSYSFNNRLSPTRSIVDRCSGTTTCHNNNIPISFCHLIFWKYAVWYENPTSCLNHWVPVHVAEKIESSNVN